MSLPLRTWIDRRGAKRTVPMQVLVLGFPRTGTASMHAALDILGYHEVYHMMNVLANPPDADLWREALEARVEGKGMPYGREEWDQLLGHCEAVTDAPCMAFSEDLIAAYPDAKVILTTRDPEKWWRSFSSTILKVVHSRPMGIAAVLDPAGFGRLRPMNLLLLESFLGPKEQVTREGAKACFVEHYEHIRALVPRERLLEYEVGEGWAPLCEFLGKDVPEGKFPRTNDEAMFREKLYGAINGVIRRFVWRATVFAMATGVAAAVYWRR
ncbi:P-loop containing nucleoside triphosphate hydrolase protein [Mycena amicta]|nr:P-loop containing nucleoside triphosphate hydrolase protein [Mycena amicta]